MAYKIAAIPMTLSDLRSTVYPCITSVEAVTSVAHWTPYPI